jgi:hypothetical protein
MTDGIFVHFNEKLGAPRTIDEEFARYQIAREAAEEFWTWANAQPGYREGEEEFHLEHGRPPNIRDLEHPDWRANTDRKLNEVYRVALEKARGRQRT